MVNRSTGTANSTLGDVIVLLPVGGQATRAQEITQGQIPKHLIQLGNGQTVLDVVCNGLYGAGFRQFVFCVGLLKDQIIDHVNTSSWAAHKDISYAFSEEEKLLGRDGAVVNAIAKLNLRGEGMVVPGDVMLPWHNLANMSWVQQQRKPDITLGVTSHITERTTDVGRMIVEDDTDRIVKCYDRNEQLPATPKGSRALTSAAATSFSIDRYSALYQSYLDANPQASEKPIGIRDEILPWAIGNPDFKILTYDVKGEVLDLGTPANIRYGQAHWRDYV